MQLKKNFEKETGYNLEDCKKCIYQICKNIRICNYFKAYSEWLEKICDAYGN